MATLQYDLAIVGVANVDRALSGLEKRFVQHNARMARAVGGPNRAIRGPNPDADLARSFQQIARAGMAADRQRYAAAKREEASAQRDKLRNVRELAKADERLQAQRSRALYAATQQQARAAAAAQREFRSRTGAVVGAAGRSVVGVGKAALAATGLAGGALIASHLGAATDLDRRQRQVIINARGAGQAGGITPAELGRRVAETSVATGATQEDVTGGLERFVARTGDLQTGLANMKNFATVATATGASVEDVASTAADLMQKFDIKKTSDMADALAVLAFQGKKGAFELRDMAETFPELAAAAQRAGMKGVGGMRTLGGLAQISRSSTGSGAEASTALQMALSQLVKHGAEIESGKALGGRTARVFTDKTQTKVGDITTVLADVISHSRGNLPQLEKVFDARGIRAVSPLITAFTAASDKAGGGARGEAAGRKAVLAAIADASNAAGTFKDVEVDAAEMMKAASVQLEILNTQLTAAVQKDLLPSLMRLGPSAQKLVPVFAELVDVTARLIDTFAENPMENIGHIIAAKVAYDIASAAIGEKVKDTIVASLSGSGPGGSRSGFLGGGSALGNALAVLTVATLAVETFKAGTLIIDNFLQNNKGQVEGDIARQQAERGTNNPDVLRGLLGQAQGELDKAQAKPGALARFGASLGPAALDEILGTGNGLFGVRQALGVSEGQLAAGKAATDKQNEKHIQELTNEIKNLNRRLAALQVVQPASSPGVPPNRGNSPSPVKP